MREHYKVHRIPQQTTPNSSISSTNPLLSTNLPHSPTLSLASIRNSLISSSSTPSTTQSSIGSHQISPPIILNLEPNLQSPSPLRIPTPNPSQTPLSSPASTSSSSRNTSFSSPLSSPSQLVNSVSTVDVAGTEDEFRGLWASRIELCTSLQGLDSLLRECTVEWLRLSTKPEDTISAPRRQTTPTERTRSHRNQNRQQQKIRRSGRKAAEEKGKLQRLYSLYPRRAVRKILEEESIGYTGTKDLAAAFLESTYSQTPPSTNQVECARAHFDRCEWKNPTSEELRILSSPPSPEEIKHRLGKACNTAPGRDGLEYRHLRALDTSGHLLASIYRAVWTYGIPACWKTSRTVPIYKKGDSSDYGNFRPISLLPTMYKIFSGILSSRIMSTATKLGWISSEQKGFLPGVRGIQEHTHLLHTVIEQAKQSKREMVIAWLDLSNAFGSIPHPILNCLFQSLPIPAELRRILSDIYSNNIMEFAVGQDSVQIHPTAGVRQGDPLSSVVFNLAAEPIIRTAKSNNTGFSAFQARVSTTAYADDIAIVGSSIRETQRTLNAVEDTATSLGLKFNPGKCTSLTLINGKSVTDNSLKIGDAEIRPLAEDDQEDYLGTPLGARLTFRPTTSLAQNLIKVADSGLAPWQKLEVYRSCLLPSLSHHLASGRVEKGALYDLDVACRDFLRRVANVPISSNTAFFYADRRVGGLGMLPLTEEADIWTIARAMQLLDSEDKSVSEVAMAQLEETIRLGYGKREVPFPIPINEYLAGSMDKGLGAIRHGGASMNLWTRSRRAAGHLKRIKIDVSGEQYSKIIADDISCISLKAVRGLRTALRGRWTSRLLSEQQGKVATGLALDMAKDTAALISCRTPLTFQEWHYLHQARLGRLPVRGCPGSKSTNKTCRLGCGKLETTDHVVCCCQVNSALSINRHNSILDLMVTEAEALGHSVSVNRAIDSTGMRPDIVVTSTNPAIIIDVTVPLSSAEGLERARNKKIEKYKDLGSVLPLVVGSLGSWLPSNDAISLALSIPGRRWNNLKRKMKLLAIQGTTRIIAKHLAYQTEGSDPPPEEDEETEDNSLLQHSL
ncbi:uncharacterized protein LOC123472237 [Daphnia magna]|uniref:uncharacterized protein LOC123472237 n=1 Tax=Daphnia magna TaxID=35525 RepID=UPI001E1BD1ED|nr:uncharacterized protein LOC123472237 [Daphnia magna]